MPDKVKIDYRCADCGAEAVSMPEPGARPGAKSSRVVVPHTPGCPTRIRVLLARARALTGDAR